MNELDILRKKIEKIDEAILKKLGERFAVVEQIGTYKKEHNISVVDKKREDQILSRLTEKGKVYQLSDILIRALWRLLFAEGYKKEA